MLVSGTQFPKWRKGGALRSTAAAPYSVDLLGAESLSYPQRRV